jgi:putative membrane protein
METGEGINSPMPAESNQPDPRIYLAEERTFLAWIRTGIAIMGFGFVVARFGLFLREMASLRTLPQLETSGLSVPLGTALLVAGVLVNIVSSVRHVRTVRALNAGTPLVTKPSTLAIVVALVLAAAGLAMAVYLSRELAAR